MTASIERDQPFTMGDWTVDPSRNLLRREGTTRQVGAKVMNLLVLLAEYGAPDGGGQVVTKETLVARLWDGDAISDEVLTTLVYGLRKALGDRARNPRYVETVRGRGYRLIARVGPVSMSESALTERTVLAGPDSAGPARSISPRGRSVRRGTIRRGTITALAAMLLAALVWGEWVPHRAAVSPPLSPVAEEAYALGQHFLDRGGAESLTKARRHLDRATREAPAFAPAQAALAEAWVETAPMLSAPAQADAFARAEAAAEAALAVDETSPTAHRVLGWLALQRDWDAGDAESRFARIGLQAEGGERHLARFFSARGEHTTATRLGRREVTSSPASSAARRSMAEILYRARRYGEALVELDRVEELEGPSLESARLRSDVLGRLGHHSEALQACIRDLELSGESKVDATALDSAFASGGLLGARRLLFRGAAQSTPVVADPLRLARLGAAAEDREASLDWLDEAAADRLAGLVWLGADPIYDPIREAPRFRDLLARIGLPIAF